VHNSLEVKQYRVKTKYGYSWLQWDSVGYRGSAAAWLDIDRCRDTAGYQGYSEIQAGIHRIQVKCRREIPKIHARGGSAVAWVDGVCGEAGGIGALMSRQ